MHLIIRDNHFDLLPERAVYWREQNLLMVADTHFAKDSIFRQQGIAIPSGADKNSFDRLSQIIDRTASRHIVFLGDFIHGKLAADHPFYDQYNQWRKRNSAIRSTLIIGNHDRFLAVDRLVETDCVNFLKIEHFLLIHEAGADADSTHFEFAGGFNIQPQRGDRCFAPCDSKVLELPLNM